MKFEFTTRLVIPGREIEGPILCTVKMTGAKVTTVMTNDGEDVTLDMANIVCPVESYFRGYPVNMLRSLAEDGKYKYFDFYQKQLS